MNFPCRICTAVKRIEPTREVKDAEFYLKERGWYVCEYHYDVCQRVLPILTKAVQERRDARREAVN